ncbi:prolyl oligopeptidase family serine peptidase [Lentisalinibacter sediminis]|uniref:prolyl oligopeptidase family serine peptidase n=1 Tax=Lentisalinibacter sediminis TaxID=2992237 RepID=UPI0038706864
MTRPASASLAAIALLLAVAAVAAPQPPFGRMDVFELEWASDPQISPDGEHIVYVRNGMDIMTDEPVGRLWLAASDSNRHEPLTGDDRDESGAVWSPDGTRIAYVAEAGDDGAEIFVYWLESGKRASLTQLETSPSGLSWSPDGGWLAFSMRVPAEPPSLVELPSKPEGAEWAETPRVTTRGTYESDGSGYLEPGFHHYFVLPADGGTPRQVTSGAFHHTGTPQWTPDGDSLVFSANRNPDWELDFVESDVYRVDMANGEITRLTDRDGPDTEPVISPDGSLIAWRGYDDKVQTYQVDRLYVMEIDGGGKRELLPELDRSVSGLAWNREGDGLYFQYADQGVTRIGFTTLGGKFRVMAENVGGTVIGRPYLRGSFSVSGDGRIAYTRATAHRPADVAVVSWLGGAPAAVTDLNADALGGRSLGRVEEFRYPSTLDMREIQGWLVKPPGYDAERDYPLLVEIHGGPISHYGPVFSPEIQLYAAAGYVVFYPNPRGSTGYGEEFGNLLYHDYPGGDYQDIMDGVDALVEAGIASEDSLYVTGGSAGGIMTAWIVGKTDRFRAAAVIKPVMNWISKTLTADNYYKYADYRYPGQPWESIEEYMKYSPVSLVGEIETPTLVMVGTADLRTPLSEAKQLYSALKIRGIDTALVEIPGAAHNIARRPSQLIAKVDHILAWLQRYPPE